MPRYRVECDDPKDGFEVATLHQAKAAAKDVAARAHAEVRVVEVSEGVPERIVHRVVPRHDAGGGTTRSAPA